MSKKDELSDLYVEILEEGWGGLDMRQPPSTRNIEKPQETNWSLSYKGQRIGGPETNMARMSTASGQNPYEQEEVAGVINKSEVFSAIDQLTQELDPASNQDQVALMILGKLKKKLG